MTRWLTIYSDPPMQLCGADAAEYVDPMIAAHEILSGVGSLRSAADGEVPNLGVTLSNADGEATAVLLDPPLGVEAALFRRDSGVTTEEFRGVVTRVQLSEVATIEVEA